ncbi:hypothetical protein LEP3755_55400 [Leptolyngbya sp. NIES-3755]|nr:hypothetical protein LEP3755_55400 [Leptolyngbya sp. NIES-3755]
MNRFIAYARKSSSVPFLVSIYRDYRTYSGYSAVAYSKLHCGSSQRSTQHQPILKKLS